MDGVLVLRRIEVRYRLDAPSASSDTIERVHALHRRHCPVYRSLESAIDIETILEIQEGA